MWNISELPNKLNIDLTRLHDLLVYDPHAPMIFSSGIFLWLFALMGLGFFLHFVPDSWEHACSKAVVRLPLVGKALLLVAMVYLVIQMKSSEIQPFIYFQF